MKTKKILFTLTTLIAISLLTLPVFAASGKMTESKLEAKKDRLEQQVECGRISAEVAQSIIERLENCDGTGTCQNDRLYLGLGGGNAGSGQQQKNNSNNTGVGAQDGTGIGAQDGTGAQRGTGSGARDGSGTGICDGTGAGAGGGGGKGGGQGLRDGSCLQ